MKPESEVNSIQYYHELINLLQKNNNLNNTAEYKKSMTQLLKNQEAMEKINSNTNDKDFSQTFIEKDNKRNILLLNIQRVAGLLKLSAQKVKKQNQEDKLDFLSKNWDSVSDKKLLKYAQRTLKVANNLGAYFFASLNTVSPKKVSKKLGQAAEISHYFGLTAEMVKELEDASMLFLKKKIVSDALFKERKNTIKSIKRLSEKNEKILDNKIDKLINIFEKSDSGFTTQYYNLRNRKAEPEKTEILEHQLA